MHVAFVDESGTPSPADGSRWFSVAVIVAASARAIELHVRRARRSLHRAPRLAELKAAQSDERVVRRLLQAIAGEPCEIYGVVVDKRKRQEAGSEARYRKAVARAVALAVAQHPRLHVTIDRRFTKSAQRLQLELDIRAAIADVPDQLVIIEQADSIAHPGLQAVDFVAWALKRQAEGVGEWAAILANRLLAVEHEGK